MLEKMIMMMIGKLLWNLNIVILLQKLTAKSTRNLLQEKVIRLKSL